LEGVLATPTVSTITSPDGQVMTVIADDGTEIHRCEMPGNELDRA
jgi:hypothetical protein